MTGIVNFPPVSVVIVNIRGTNLLQSCLESVFNSNYPNFEVVVVGKCKNIGGWLRQNFDHKSNYVKLCHLDHDLGLSAFRNIGLKACRSNTKYVVFLDNDTEVDRNWLNELIGVIESDPMVGVAQGKILLSDDRRRINSTGCFISRYGYTFIRGFGEVDQGQYDDITEIFYASGCMMAIRHHLFLSVGLFDERIFYGHDDLDICWRIRLKGYKVVYVPNAIVYHKFGATRKHIEKPQYAYVQYPKSHLVTLIKNHDLRNLLMSIPIIIILILRSSLTDIVSKDVWSGLAKLSAIYWVLRNLKSIFKDRLTLTRRASVNDWFNADFRCPKFMGKTPYTDNFFRERTDSLKSARRIVPIVLELVQPKSVVDVGCGTGEFLYVFKENGINDILGVDGKWVNKKMLRIPDNLFLSANLEKPLKIDRKFDLVVSLEVAEHLPEHSTKTFIETLTSLGSVILFSAAIPFQGGVHHVNEQWPEYWVKLFNQRDYVPIDCIRKKIWKNEDVSFWYAQNILLFVKKEYEQTSNSFLSIVHPKLYFPKAKRYDFIMKMVPYPVKWIIIKLKNLGLFHKSSV